MLELQKDLSKQQLSKQFHGLAISPVEGVDLTRRQHCCWQKEIIVYISKYNKPVN